MKKASTGPPGGKFPLRGGESISPALYRVDAKGGVWMNVRMEFSTTHHETAVLLLGLGHAARVEDGRFHFPPEARRDAGKVKWMLSELRKDRTGTK